MTGSMVIIYFTPHHSRLWTAALVSRHYIRPIINNTEISWRSHTQVSGHAQTQRPLHGLHRSELRRRRGAFPLVLFTPYDPPGDLDETSDEDGEHCCWAAKSARFVAPPSRIPSSSSSFWLARSLPLPSRNANLLEERRSYSPTERGHHGSTVGNNLFLVGHGKNIGWHPSPAEGCVPPWTQTLEAWTKKWWYSDNNEATTYCQKEARTNPRPIIFVFMSGLTAIWVSGGCLVLSVLPWILCRGSEATVSMALWR